MKNLIPMIIVGLLLASSIAGFAQEAKTVKLEQTPGEFKTKELKLKAGKPYVFDVTNKGVDHAVGFVIAPAGKTDQDHHVQAAYLSKTIKDGESAKSGEVTLEKGEYVYFCPLNPTPQYKITVK
ncbi:MAG: cupredoxin domain-containing protein [Cytophagales bacterium]|nr:cupredoxin domain-containing protein [Cytophagales bacterium]